MKKLLISIIIPNFNGEKYLDTCLKSILATSYKNFEVLLVDDGSTDKSLKIVKEFQKKDKRIFLLRNKKNLGAAASRNKAIKRIKGGIIVFLDNDTEVTKNWLKELVKPLLREKDIGATQALLLDFEKRDLIQMAGGLLISQVGWLIPFYQWKRYKEVKDKLKERGIIAVSAALAVKKEVIVKVKGFDEKEALYTEDLDFSWRIWVAGYKIMLAPKAIIYHYTKSIKDREHMGASSRQIYFHLAKNSFRSMIKNYEMRSLIKFLPMSIFVNLARGLLLLFKRQDYSALSATVFAIGWNLLNLKDTIMRRFFIQKHRVFRDKELLDKIFEKGSLPEVYNKHFKQTGLL